MCARAVLLMLLCCCALCRACVVYYVCRFVLYDVLRLLSFTVLYAWYMCAACAVSRVFCFGLCDVRTLHVAHYFVVPYCACAWHVRYIVLVVVHCARTSVVCVVCCVCSLLSMLYAVMCGWRVFVVCSAFLLFVLRVTCILNKRVACVGFVSFFLYDACAVLFLLYALGVRCVLALHCCIAWVLFSFWCVRDLCAGMLYYAALCVCFV